jgi:hypothetical protein
LRRKIPIYWVLQRENLRLGTVLSPHCYNFTAALLWLSFLLKKTSVGAGIFGFYLPLRLSKLTILWRIKKDFLPFFYFYIFKTTLKNSAKIK